MKCPYCGMESRKPGAKFCENCGRPLASNTRGANPTRSRNTRADPARKRKKMTWILVGAALAAVLIIAAVFTISGNRKKYDRDTLLNSIANKSGVSSGAENSASQQASDGTNSDNADGTTSGSADATAGGTTSGAENGTTGQNADASVTQPAASADSSEYILPDSSIKLLTEQDIAGFSAAKLRLARNEIFARHGRIFNSEDLKTYFESKSWYHGTIQPDVFDASLDSRINEIEKENVGLIKTAEANAVQ